MRRQTHGATAKVMGGAGYDVVGVEMDRSGEASTRNSIARAQQRGAVTTPVIAP